MATSAVKRVTKHYVGGLENWRFANDRSIELPDRNTQEPVVLRRANSYEHVPSRASPGIS